MPIDYKKYPVDWKTRIRPDILKKDKDCCRFCGVGNGVYVFRGLLNGQEVFQTANADIFEYPSGKYVDTDAYAPIEPLSGDVNQQAIKIVLTIMHLDHNIMNNDYSNLAAGCQKCHLGYDRENHSKNSRATIEKKKGLQKLF